MDIFGKEKPLVRRHRSRNERRMTKNSDGVLEIGMEKKEERFNRCLEEEEDR